MSLDLIIDVIWRGTYEKESAKNINYGGGKGSRHVTWQHDNESNFFTDSSSLFTQNNAIFTHDEDILSNIFDGVLDAILRILKMMTHMRKNGGSLK